MTIRWDPPQESEDYITLEYQIRDGIEGSELRTRSRRSRTSFTFSNLGTYIYYVYQMYVSRMNVLYMYVVAGVPYEVRVVAATNGGEGEENRLILFLKEQGNFTF